MEERAPARARPVKRARLNSGQQNLELLGEYLLKREYGTAACQDNADHYLARWQARQLAKGFVDNTINRVLDSWLVSPLPQTLENNQLLALDVADYFDNMGDDDSVENEGILMAISAHGLQSHGDAGRHGPVAGPSHSGAVRPQPCSCSSAPRHEDPPTPLVPFHRRHKVPISVSSDSLDVSSDSSSSSSSSSLTPDNVNEQYEDHFDFMDAAVSFAIQNKGLTSFGSVDYG